MCIYCLLESTSTDKSSRISCSSFEPSSDFDSKSRPIQDSSVDFVPNDSQSNNYHQTNRLRNNNQQFKLFSNSDRIPPSTISSFSNPISSIICSTQLYDDHHPIRSSKTVNSDLKLPPDLRLTNHNDDENDNSQFDLKNLNFYDPGICSIFDLVSFIISNKLF